MNGLFEVSIFFESLEIDFFDGYFFLCVVLEAFKDFAERAFTETFVSVVTVLSDGFYHCILVLHGWDF